MSTKRKDPQAEQGPPFEAALAELEKIVATMEQGAVPLAEMVTQFEKGNALLKICQQRLHEAELKIEQLKPGDAELTLEPFPDKE